MSGYVKISIEDYNILLKNNIELREEKNRYLNELGKVQQLMFDAMTKEIERKHMEWMYISSICVTDMCRIMDIDFEVLKAQVIDTYQKNHPTAKIDEGYQE